MLFTAISKQSHDAFSFRKAPHALLFRQMSDLVTRAATREQVTVPLTVCKENCYFLRLTEGILDSSVGTVTSLRAGRFGLPSPVRPTDVSSIENMQTGSGAHLSSHPKGCQGCCPQGAKRLGREADHSLVPVSM